MGRIAPKLVKGTQPVLIAESGMWFQHALGFLTTPIGWIIIVQVLLGGFLRCHAFKFPGFLLFDEHHFVENARNYLTGQPDWNDHPPLGKLIIAAFIRLLGDNPIGWRASALTAGITTIVVGSFAAGRLFRSPEAGLIAAGLLSADGFLISYSRVGLLDGYLATCSVAALLLATMRVNVRLVVAAGLLLGLAVNIKFSGLGVLPPTLLVIAVTPMLPRKQAALVILLLCVSVATYASTYAFGLAIDGQSASLSEVIHRTNALIARHAKSVDMQNPWTSGWVTWAVPLRPMVLGRVGGLGEVRILSSLGNLVIWWSSITVSACVLGLVVWVGIAETLRPVSYVALGRSQLVEFVGAHGRGILVILSVAAGFLAPWVMTHRDSYIYHFLPTYSALIVLLAGFMSSTLTRHGRYTLAVLVMVLMVTAFYAPVWSFLPLSPEALQRRLFLPQWR